MAERHRRVLARRTLAISGSIQYAGHYAEALRNLPEQNVGSPRFPKTLAQAMRETGEAMIAFADDQERGGQA